MSDIYKIIVTMTEIINRCAFDEVGNARCTQHPNAEENKADVGDRR